MSLFHNITIFEKHQEKITTNIDTHDLVGAAIGRLIFASDTYR